jgi:hypothetical protein
VLCSELPEGGWRRIYTLWGSLIVPFFRAFPCRPGEVSRQLEDRKREKDT